MSICCINPECEQPKNSDHHKKCQSCNSPLVFELGESYSVVFLDKKDKNPWIAEKRFADGKIISRVYEAKNRIDGSIRIFKVLYSQFPRYVTLFDREVRVLNKLNQELRTITLDTSETDSFLRVPKVSEHIECVSYEVNLQSQKYPTARYLVMEKIEGENLEEWKIEGDSSQVTEEQAIKWLKQILIIIEKIHDLNIIHRDIHPRNIIRTPQNKLVLIDFGCVREILDGVDPQYTQVWSMGYTPSEQEKGNPLFQSDFYALGHTFVYLLTGYNPSSTELYDQDWKTLTNNNISNSLLNLIDWLKQKEIQNRPKDIKTILNTINSIRNAEDLEAYVSRNNNQLSNDQLAIDWLIQLAYSLKYKHDNNLIHRDIHPSNIILHNNKKLELLNFGTEINVDFVDKDNIFSVNREGYTANEQIQGKPSFQSDFYALGHTFVYLLTGYHPTAIELQNTDWKTLTNNNISNSFLDLIDWLKQEEIENNPIDWLIRPNLGKRRPRNADQIITQIQNIQSNSNQSPRRRTNNQLPLRLGCILFILISFASAGIWALWKNPPSTECKVIEGQENDVGISKQIEKKIKSKLGKSLLSLNTLQKELDNGKCDIYLNGEIVNEKFLDYLIEEIHKMSPYINSIYIDSRFDNKIYQVKFCLPKNYENLSSDYLGQKLEEDYNKNDYLKELYIFRLPTNKEIESYSKQPQVISQDKLMRELEAQTQKEIIIFQKGCEIILKGQVDTKNDKSNIIDIAKNLEGVRRVNSVQLKIILSQND